MKVLIIPDVHGLTTWKEQVSDAIATKDTHIRFLGDYVDSYNVSTATAIWNLKDIVKFKKKYPTRITLLLGNHDFAYVFSKTNTSGFQFHMWDEYCTFFNSNWNYFQLAWGFQGKDKYTLLTHAGLTKYFYDNIVNEIMDPQTVMNEILVKKADVPWESLPLHELLNYFINNIDLLWQVGYIRWGSNLTGSIIWADKSELKSHRYPGIDQIVGHTCNKYIEIAHVDDDKLYFIDVHTDNDVIGFLTELV